MEAYKINTYNTEDVQEDATNTYYRRITTFLISL